MVCWPTNDVIVVGSRVSASWAVKEPTEDGRKIVLLEAGRNLDIVHDFGSRAMPICEGLV